MGGDSTLFTSLVITNAVLAWLAFASCGVSLFAPAWITMTYEFTEPGHSEVEESHTVAKVHMGLVVYCVTDNVNKESVFQDCTWFKEGGMKTPGWMATTRALVGAATCVNLLAAACSNVLFFKGLRNPECSSLLIASSLLGLGTIAAAVITFGFEGNKDLNVKFQRHEELFFDWGYYVAIIAAGISLCAFLVTIVTISLVTRKGKKRYTQIITQTAQA